MSPRSTSGGEGGRTRTNNWWGVASSPSPLPKRENKRIIGTYHETHMDSRRIGVCLPVGAAEMWPQFRGPEGRAVATDRGLPDKFGPNENIRWKADLPGRGFHAQSSRAARCFSLPTPAWIKTACTSSRSTWPPARNFGNANSGPLARRSAMKTVHGVSHDRHRWNDGVCIIRR